GSDENPTVQQVVAQALNSKGRLYAKKADRREAIALFDEVLLRFGACGEPALLEEISRALVEKAECLDLLGQRGEALETLADVIGRMGSVREEEDSRLVVSPGMTRNSTAPGIPELFERAENLKKKLTTNTTEDHRV